MAAIEEDMKKQDIQIEKSAQHQHELATLCNEMLNKKMLPFMP